MLKTYFLPWLCQEREPLGVRTLVLGFGIRDSGMLFFFLHENIVISAFNVDDVQKNKTRSVLMINTYILD